MQKFLFVLSPPYSGSTVLWRLLSSAEAVSALPTEGQMLPSVVPLLRGDHWNPEKPVPWEQVRARWLETWDTSRAILLEKSPPNLVRAEAIERYFDPAWFVLLSRDPYAFSEGYMRRKRCSARVAAEFWLFCARWTLYNLDRLSRTLLITYEELVTEPATAAARLSDFVPELGVLSTDDSYRAHSIHGRGARQLTDLNEIKIRQLSGRDIREISAVLNEDVATVRRLGYAARAAGIKHDAQHLWAVGSLRISHFQERAARLLARIRRSASSGVTPRQR
jgi:hypothetical protein